MIEQNGLIGLPYCGLVALASLLILVRIYVLFVDARERKKKKSWVLLFGTNNNDE